jgi:hypothetical protein
VQTHHSSAVPVQLQYILRAPPCAKTGSVFGYANWLWGSRNLCGEGGESLSTGVALEHTEEQVGRNVCSGVGLQYECGGVGVVDRVLEKSELYNPNTEVSQCSPM